VVTEISELKQVEKALRQREKELETKTRTLEEVNTTLNALLKKKNEEKAEVEKNVLSNLKKLVMPYLEKLKRNGFDKRKQVYIGNLESTLNDIVSPLSRRLPNLSPTEIQVANLVKQGRRSKEIAELMNLSPRTIESHRDNIRKKIGIKTRKNLRTYLLSVQNTDFFKTLVAHD
jgi:DNA-binding CsgD family transcriptional regulator